MAIATKNGNGAATNRIANISPNGKSETVTISPPNFQVASFKIRGTAQYVQNKFSAKARAQIQATQEAGSTAKGKKKRSAKDFRKCYEECQYVAADGSKGVPAGAFRNALVSACKAVGFAMTRAKIALFIIADCHDADDLFTPMVKITKGKPKMVISPARNANGAIDLRARAHWEEGWEATVRVRYDADMFTLNDVANLMAQVGIRIGIGEGRPDSKDSCGMDWGMFEIVN